MPSVSPAGSQRFLKEERLYSRKSIDQLFKAGTVRKTRDLRFHFMTVPREESEFHRVLFAVPRKNIKKAVDRNRIRRLMRESYRLNKRALYHDETRLFSYFLAYVYISHYVPGFGDMEKQITATFKYLPPEKI